MHCKRVKHEVRDLSRARRVKPSSRPGRLRAWLQKSGVIVRQHGMRLFG